MPIAVDNMLESKEGTTGNGIEEIVGIDKLGMMVVGMDKLGTIVEGIDKLGTMVVGSGIEIVIDVCESVDESSVIGDRMLEIELVELVITVVVEAVEVDACDTSVDEVSATPVLAAELSAADPCLVPSKKALATLFLKTPAPELPLLMRVQIWFWKVTLEHPALLEQKLKQETRSSAVKLVVLLAGRKVLH